MDRSATQVLMLSLIALVLVIAALDHASTIALPTIMAVLAAIALAPLARRIESIGIPPSLASAVIVAGIVFASVATVYALLPSAEAWNARAPQVIREIEQRARQVSAGLSDAISATTGEAQAEAGQLQSPASSEPEPTPEAEDSENGEDPVGKLVEDGQKMVADWAIGAPRFVAGTVYWAVLTFFLLRDRAMLGRTLMALGPGLPARRALGRAMKDVQSDVAYYLLAITLINVALGFCVAGAFYLFDVPNAALWGVLAGVMNFMPFIGGAIMAVVTVGVGLVTFDDPLIAVFLLGAVIFLNTIESQIVTPLVIGASVRLSAIAIFVAIAFGAWLWGAAGALVATPMLIVISAFVARLNAAGRAAPLPRQSGPG